MRTALVILLAVLLIVALKFGTVSPCGILRAQVRQEAARQGGMGLLVSALPDSVLDALLASQFGSLSPGRCIALAISGAPVQPPAQNVRPAPTISPVQPNTSPPRNFLSSDAQAALRQAAAETRAAEKECQDKRLSGALPSFAASAACSNPRILEAYRKAGYRYMDLIVQFTSKRAQVAEELDLGQMTKAQGQLAMSQFMTALIDEQRQRDRGQK